MTTGSGFYLDPGEQRVPFIVESVRQLMEGRSNAVGLVTLTANAASTVVTAPSCGPNSAVFLYPTTANAAAIVASTYVSAVAPRSFTVTHTNSATADKTFYWLAIG